MRVGWEKRAYDILEGEKQSLSMARASVCKGTGSCRVSDVLEDNTVCTWRMKHKLRLKSTIFMGPSVPELCHPSALHPHASLRSDHSKHG